VELPSIFLECWVYHRPTLVKMARHHETGASLPDAVIGRLLAARAHRGASFLLGQSSFTRMDFRVHDAIEHYTPEHVHALGLETLREIRTLKPLAEDRMLCSFSHLFAGGYAAGYYSYLWAGVLARDAFAAFQALDGDELAEAKLGRRWRHEVLAPGGSVHPMVLFEGFLGRAPDVAAVLNWYGLDSDAADA
jgi:oligopeptidase A